MTSIAKQARGDSGADPREFRWLPVGELDVDQNTQREVDPEKVARIKNEFDWFRFEAITVAQHDSRLTVIEGQHRALARMQIDPSSMVPCMVISAETDPKAQAQLALDIVQGRSGHTAYEKWRQRYNAGHDHEVFAEITLSRHGVRVGQAVSAMTIGAVATVKSIVHGGNLSAEVGAELLDQVVTIIMAAFPTFDHDSNVTRWHSAILRATAELLRKAPDLDQRRLSKAFTIRPATQWINLGQGAPTTPAYITIQEHLVTEYNRNRRRGRIEL